MNSLITHRHITKTTSKPVTQVRWILFITLVLICTNQNVMSLPVTDSNASKGSARVGPEGTEFWVLPCGSEVEGNTPPYPDYVLAEQYGSYLSNDWIFLDQWKNNFSMDKFAGMSFDNKVKEDETFRYDWLQVNTVIPKKPSQHLDASHYSQQQFAAMLTQSSNIFQRIAIGWEQMDYDKTDSYYKDHFYNTKFRIRNTLCQLEQYLAEKRMSPAPNPTRSIMPTELRSITAASARDERNFRILKEYVNALEYYADAFNYFATSLAQKQSSL